MADDARGDDEDREAGGSGPERPVDVLRVGEERLVEEADPVERGARDEHRAAAGAAGRVRRGLRGAAGARSPCAAPGGRAAGRTGARVPDRPGALVEDLRARGAHRDRGRARRAARASPARPSRRC